MIYFIADTLDGWDGASRAATDFLQHLTQLHRAIVVVSRTTCVQLPRVNGAPAPHVRWVTPAAPLSGTQGLGLSPRRWVSWSRGAARQVGRRLRVAAVTRLFPPTLAIHNAFPLPDSPANRIMDLSPKRLILVHSSPDTVTYFMRRRQSPTSWVAAELARAQALIFVSPQIRDAWAAIADIAGIPSWVLSNTCREDDASAVRAIGRDDLRASLGLPPQAFVAACVGYVHRGKGQDALVQALPEMVRARPDLLVVFVGEDTSADATALKATIAGRDLTDHVRFTGRRKNPYAYIRAADLLIHPSRAEGQAMVLLEAMLLGTPVLASDVGGIPSVITHGETGWLVPPDDRGALIDGFQRLGASQELRRALAEQGERAYWTRFSRREYGKRFHAIFQQLLVGA